MEKETILQFPSLDNAVSTTKLPSYLTSMEEKKFFYAIEPSFRESFEDADEIFGSHFKEYSLATSAMIFKPDAIVDRKVEAALNHVINRGFTPIAFRLFTYNKFIIREDWKYQYNIATRNRMRIVDYLLETAPSLFVVFKKTPQRLNNACAEMTSLKGHSDPSLRTSEDLRYHLRGINSLLNYIHTCDEPADFYRGTGLYFNEVERRKLFSEIALRTDLTDKLFQFVEKLYGDYPKVNLDLQRVLITLKDSATVLDPTMAEKIIRICDRPDTISDDDWHFLYILLTQTHKNLLNRWDTIILLTSTVRISLENGTAIIY
jgi:nucleoside diphosphate kinase